MSRFTNHTHLIILDLISDIGIPYVNVICLFFFAQPFTILFQLYFNCIVLLNDILLSKNFQFGRVRKQLHLFMNKILSRTTNDITSLTVTSSASFKLFVTSFCLQDKNINVPCPKIVINLYGSSYQVTPNTIRIHYTSVFLNHLIQVLRVDTWIVSTKYLINLPILVVLFSWLLNSCGIELPPPLECQAQLFQIPRVIVPQVDETGLPFIDIVPANSYPH